MTDIETKHHLSMATRLLDVHKAWSPSGLFVARRCRVSVLNDSVASSNLVATCEMHDHAVMLCAYANTAPQLAKEVVRLNGVIDSLSGEETKQSRRVYNAWLDGRIIELELIEKRARGFIAALDGMGESAMKQDIRHSHAHYESYARMLRESLAKVTS